MDEKRYQIDAYVVDALMRDLVGHDHRASAFLVYLALAAAAQEGEPRLSHAQLAERTGLSKRGVQTALLHLVDRALLRVTRVGVPGLAVGSVLMLWSSRLIGCGAP